MNTVLRELDAMPVTLVIAITYGTLAVVTRMMGAPDEFAAHLQSHGLLRPAAIADHQAWRLVAHAFLHGNVLHLLLNLGTLVAIGPALERTLGSLRYALLYLVAAVGGGIAVCLWYEPGHSVLGGSGALFGMMGALVAINMRAGRHLFAFLDFEGPRRLLSTIVVNLLVGMAIPVVSNTAHCGGLLSGFLLTFFWLRPGDATSAFRRWRLATLALFASSLAWSFAPVTRVDWLLHAANATTDPTRRLTLLRAAAAAHRSVPPELLAPESPAEPPRRGR